MPVEVSSLEEYQKYMEKTHILSFWAEWCGTSTIMAPVLEELEQSADGKW